MTGVVFRVVRTEFEKKARAPGGKKISAALADADASLKTLGPRSLVLIEEGLARIRALVGESDQRIAAHDLTEIHRIADQLMGYCVTVDRPRLPECLRRICLLADAVNKSETWLPGTFGPALTIADLTARAAMSPAEIDTLLDGVDLCIARYRALAPAPAAAEPQAPAG